MIHLPALPGAPNYDGQRTGEIARQAVEDVEAIQDGGLDGALLQNSNDHPPARRVPAVTVAAYTAVAAEVSGAAAIPIGINVLKSDPAATIGIAVVVGARFVRLKTYVGAEIGAEGLTQGCAAEAIRLRRQLSAEDELEIWADAVQPTSRSLAGISPTDAARWCVEFGHADRLIITGDSLEDSLTIIKQIRSTVSVPVILGGGVEPGSVHRGLDESDGLIVGRYLREGGLSGPIVPSRIHALVTAVRASLQAASPRG